MQHTKLDTIFTQHPIPSDYFREYSRYLFHLLANLDFEIIENVADLILAKAKEGRAVYIIGNGGSATTASHFATDLSHCGYIDHKPIIRAVSLTENIALLTAMSNDRGFEHVFTRQVEHIFQKGDILIAISASGNSPNLVSAIMQAKKMGGTTVGMVGFDGGTLAELCDYVIEVRTEKGEYGPVEDVHLFLDHMISSYLGIKLMRGQKKKRSAPRRNKS